jgi:hypothetical protein
LMSNKAVIARRPKADAAIQYWIASLRSQ